jgi:SAM-dependent methyltransferase
VRAAWLRPLARRLLPASVRRRLRAALGPLAVPPENAPTPPGARASPLEAPGNIYERLYEAHGRHFSDEDVVGAGNFDLIGRLELGVLLAEGLRPTDTVVDFGCGTGRLAVHLIPVLRGGHYVGVDVARSMLDKAESRIARGVPAPPCRISWVHQTETTFPLPDRSVDLVCAFSVFTHIEHEDTYRYLRDALRVVRPGGRFVFSCLPMDLAAAREVFLLSAREDFSGRWGQVRNVTTSVDLMEAVARLAGWVPLRWYPGDRLCIPLPGSGELMALGQSTCVLEAPGGRPTAVGPRAEVIRGSPPAEAGRIELRWETPALRLEPHFTGPLAGGGRFHLYVSPDPATMGSLEATPFARLQLDPDGLGVTLKVRRAHPGVYRYAVVARGENAGEALDRSGAQVRVVAGATELGRVAPPPGQGNRWTVADIEVGPWGAELRPLGLRDRAPTEVSADPWSPSPAGGPSHDPDPSCPVCEARAPHEQVMVKHVYHYRRCRGCGVLYAVPRPSRAALVRRLGELAAAPPALSPAEQAQALQAVRYRIECLRRHHPAARSVLDIGAGNGAFVAAAQQAGLTALGVDLAPGGARVPGVEVLVGDLLAEGPEALPLRPGSWDAVTLWDTVEHLAAPLPVLRQALALLSPGGILVVETPNERGLSARLRGAEWWVFGPSDHLVMFSRATLALALRCAGGRVVALETRQLCPWAPPGGAPPLAGLPRLFERARRSPALHRVAAGLGLGDWVLAVARR